MSALDDEGDPEDGSGKVAQLSRLLDCASKQTLTNAAFHWAHINLLADEIEQLRAENAEFVSAIVTETQAKERLRAALERIAALHKPRERGLSEGAKTALELVAGIVAEAIGSPSTSEPRCAVCDHIRALHEQPGVRTTHAFVAKSSVSTSVLRPGPGATVDDHGRVQWTTRDLLKAFAGTQEPHCATCQCYPSTSAESSGVKGSGDEERDSDSAPTSNSKPLQIGDPCPTCASGYVGQSGGNYRCANCGWLGPSIR